MNVKDRRRAALQDLIDEDTGPDRGKKARCAERIGKSPAQVSQWLSGYRTIDDESAREIERSAGKPKWWMDGGAAATASAQQVPDLAAALAVVLEALAALPATRWVSVRAQLDQVVGRAEPQNDTLSELLLLLASPGKPQRLAA